MVFINLYFISRLRKSSQQLEYNVINSAIFQISFTQIYGFGFCVLIIIKLILMQLLNRIKQTVVSNMTLQKKLSENVRIIRKFSKL